MDYLLEMLQALSDIHFVLFLVFKHNGMSSIKIKKKKKSRFMICSQIWLFKFLQSSDEWHADLCEVCCNTSDHICTAAIAMLPILLFWVLVLRELIDWKITCLALRMHWCKWQLFSVVRVTQNLVHLHSRAWQICLL